MWGGPRSAPFVLRRAPKSVCPSCRQIPGCGTARVRPILLKFPEPVDLQHPHWGGGARSGAAKPQGPRARRRLPAAGDRPGRRVGARCLPRRLGATETSEMQPAMSRKSRRGAPSPSSRLWRVSWLRLGRCKIRSRREARELAAQGRGGGSGEVCLQADRKVQILSCASAPVADWRLGVRSHEERVREVSVLPAARSSRLLALRDLLCFLFSFSCFFFFFQAVFCCI